MSQSNEPATSAFGTFCPFPTGLTEIGRVYRRWPSWAKSDQNSPLLTLLDFSRLANYSMRGLTWRTPITLPSL
jgi:hypothetical protein